MKETLINNKWKLLLPEHKANRPGWSFWERERLAAMYAAIRPGDCIFDIGAEEGDMSALFASWIGEKGKLVLVEPSAEFWPCIRQTFEANNLKGELFFQGFVSNFHVPAVPTDPAAMIHPSGTDADMWDAYLGNWPKKSLGDIDPNAGFKHLNENDKHIPITTIYNIANSYHLLPDVLTMDIEGAEYEAVQGIEELFKITKPILFISIHPEFMRERYNHTPDDLLVLLEKQGYESTYLGYDHEQHYMFKPKLS